MQAAIITDETTSLPPRARPGFEHELLELAPACSTSSLRRRAKTLREKRHPETITARRAKKAADRHLELKPDYDGMAWLSAYLPAETAVAAFNRVQAIALSVQGPEEPRTLTQLRADALTHLLLTGTPKPAGGEATVPGADAGTADTAAAGIEVTAVRAVPPAGGLAAGGPAETGPVDPREHPALDGGLPPGTGYGIVPTVALTIPSLTLLGLGQEPAHRRATPLPAPALRKMHVLRLLPLQRPLRTRPHHRLGRRRIHQHGQPRPRMQAPPPPQNRNRLEPPTTQPRRIRLDLPLRNRLPDQA